eukprot:3994029-Amphidinium_carterae.1
MSVRRSSCVGAGSPGPTVGAGTPGPAYEGTEAGLVTGSGLSQSNRLLGDFGLLVHLVGQSASLCAQMRTLIAHWKGFSLLLLHSKERLLQWAGESLAATRSWCFLSMLSKAGAEEGVAGLPGASAWGLANSQ